MGHRAEEVQTNRFFNNCADVSISRLRDDLGRNGANTLVASTNTTVTNIAKAYADNVVPTTKSMSDQVTEE